jgi:hypothetical protein
MTGWPARRGSGRKARRERGETSAGASTAPAAAVAVAAAIGRSGGFWCVGFQSLGATRRRGDGEAAMGERWRGLSGSSRKVGGDAASGPSWAQTGRPN